MGPEIRPQCIGHWGYACGPAKVATMGDVASPSRGRSIAPSAATWPRGTRWRRYPWRRLTRGRSPRMAVSMPWRSRPARPGQDGIRRLGVDRRERGGKRPRPPVSADGKPGVWGSSSRYRRPPPPHMAAPLVPGSGAQGAQDCGWVRTQSCPPAQSSPGGCRRGLVFLNGAGGLMQAASTVGPAPTRPFSHSGPWPVLHMS